MDWSPRCYIPTFVEIGLPVSDKKIFEGFLPYMGMAPILDIGNGAIISRVTNTLRKKFLNR